MVSIADVLSKFAALYSAAAESNNCPYIVGLPDILGDIVGLNVVGLDDGLLVGVLVTSGATGAWLGELLGDWVGEPLGEFVGLAVGELLGELLGLEVGLLLGLELGVTEGLLVGFELGLEVGL